MVRIQNMDLEYTFLCLLIHFCNKFEKCHSESISYFSTEHPVIEWFNTEYVRNATMISRRLSRQDPRHYVDLFLDTIVTFDNNVTLDFYFYQFLTNRYRPSFVEMHFKLCDMIKSDAFFGNAMKKAFADVPCPIPPGEHSLKNMTISYVPKGFPFTKGRIYCNLTILHGGVFKHIGRGSIDMELKVAKINKSDKKH